jgi:hypothetical protein
MELANLSAPVEPDEPLGDRPIGDAPVDDRSGSAYRRETKTRLEEALSLLMVLAFPVNSGTERAVRDDLNEALGSGQRVESMQMRIGNRKINLGSKLGRHPSKQQIELRDALLEFLPGRTQEDL